MERVLVCAFVRCYGYLTSHLFLTWLLIYFSVCKIENMPSPGLFLYPY